MWSGIRCPRTCPSCRPSKTLSGCTVAVAKGANTKAAHTPAPGSHLKSTPSNRTATVQPPWPSLSRTRPPRTCRLLWPPKAPDPLRSTRILRRRGWLRPAARSHTPTTPSSMEMQRLLDAGELAGRAPLQLGPGIRLDDVERSVRVDIFAPPTRRVSSGGPPRPAGCCSRSRGGGIADGHREPETRWLPPDRG